GHCVSHCTTEPTRLAPQYRRWSAPLASSSCSTAPRRRIISSAEKRGYSASTIACRFDGKDSITTRPPSRRDRPAPRDRQNRDRTKRHLPQPAEIGENWSPGTAAAHARSRGTRDRGML